MQKDIIGYQVTIHNLLADDKEIYYCERCLTSKEALSLIKSNHDVTFYQVHADDRGGFDPLVCDNCQEEI